MPNTRCHRRPTASWRSRFHRLPDRVGRCCSPRPAWRHNPSDTESQTRPRYLRSTCHPSPPGPRHRHSLRHRSRRRTSQPRERKGTGMNGLPRQCSTRHFGFDSGCKDRRSILRHHHRTKQPFKSHRLTRPKTVQYTTLRPDQRRTIVNRARQLLLAGKAPWGVACPVRPAWRWFARRPHMTKGEIR